MISQKRIFDGGMNADDSLRLLSDREYIQLMNGRVGKSRTGKDYRVENVPGTLQLVSGVLPVGTNMTIGSAVDEGRNRLIYFNYNSNGNHGIYAYDLLTNTNYIVLLSSQVSGGFNFVLNFRIDRNARVVGDQLYWTDYYNEPRCINVERGIKLNQSGYATSYSPYVSPLLYTDVTLIKRTPIYALTASKVTDSSFPNNLTANSSFQFCYRYNYKDNQISALSEFSNLIPYNYQSETYNAVDIAMPTSEKVDDYVQSIDFVVRFGNNGNSFIVKTLNKNIAADAAAIAAHNAGAAYTFRFYNNKTGIALDSITANTSYDYIPLLTRTLEVARNRLFLANNVVGYDSPSVTSLGISVTDTSIANDNIPIIKGAAGSIGFNTPTTVPFTLTGAPIINPGNYVIRNQTYSSSSNDDNNTQYPTYPADSDCIFWNTSNTKTYSFSLSALAYMYNDNVDSQISVIAYLCGSPNTKKIQKFSTFTTSKGKRYNDRKVNVQVVVPPLTKVFIAVYPDLGVTGSNDNQIEFRNVKCYLSDITNLSYGNPIFKTGSSYKGAVVFFDRFKRKSGVVSQDSAVMSTSNRSFATNPNNTGAWSLSNTNALNEIPSWAYYYQVQLSKNLSKQTYIQGYVYDIRYGMKDSATNLSYYTEYNYATNAFCIAVNIKGLTDAGLGYTFTEGDQIFLYSDIGTSYTLKVIGTDGYWVQVEKKDIGTLGSTYNWGCEIYSPFIGTISESFYAATPVYSVSNPTTNTRSYSTISGSLVGDTYYLYRTQGTSFLYKAEAMNPNDKFWSTWDINIGWINIVDTIGQKTKISNIQFSDVFIQGSKVNGLSKFQVLNQKDASSDSGSIMKLQLTNKQGQATGTIILAVCSSDTISLYLGESQITASASNAFVAVSDSVIGSMNSLKNNFGTQHPESVFAYLGDVFWFDVVNGIICQYSTNGNMAVSSYKMASFFDKYSRDYLALGNAGVTTLNGFSHVSSCFDPLHKEIAFNLPAITSANNLLPSYSNITPSYASSIINRFDVYDGLAKSVTLNIEKNKWISVFEGIPEWCELLNTDVFLFKNGVLWKKEADTANYNTFFGVQYPTRLVFTPNTNPSEIKDLMNVAIEGTQAPDYSVFYADNPNQQISDLVSSDYVNKEGVYYAAIMRDRLSPNTGSTDPYTRSLLGDFIKDPAPKVMLEFQTYNKLLAIDFVNIGTVSSKGHATINKQ